jgi:hypothetical protein
MNGGKLPTLWFASAAPLATLITRFPERFMLPAALPGSTNQARCL